MLRPIIGSYSVLIRQERAFYTKGTIFSMKMTTGAVALSGEIGHNGSHIGHSKRLLKEHESNE